MDKFTSYSGNGYVERRSQELRSINRQFTYQKKQQQMENKEEKPITSKEPTSQEKISQMQHLTELPQNHLKLPGNNQFNRN